MRRSSGHPKGARRKRPAAPSRIRRRRDGGRGRCASDVILSICPPHAAREVAGSVAGFEGIYVDANAIAPATARDVLGAVRRAASTAGSSGARPSPRLYLSGPEAPAVARALRRHRCRTPRRLGRARAGVGSQGHLRRLVEGNGRDAPRHRRAGAGGGRRGARCWPSGRIRFRSCYPGSRALAAPPTRRAGAGSARWRRSPTAFAAHGLPDGFYRAAAEVYRWPQGVPS